MKHFFETINGWTSIATMNLYRDAIRMLPDSSILVEVGVFEGRSLAFAGVEIVNSGKRMQIIGVDIWAWQSKGYGNGPKKFYDTLTGEQAYALATKHLRPLVDVSVVQLLRSESVLAAKSFDDGTFGLVYIDGDHTYESVKADIAAWRLKVRQGGIMGGHDYSPKSWPGVIRAVDEAFGKKAISVEGTTWRITL